MSDYFDRVERQLVRQVSAGVPRRTRFPLRFARVAPVISLLAAVAIAGVFLSVGGARHASAPAARTVQIMYAAEPTAQNPVVTPVVLRHAVTVMRARIAQSGVRGASVQLAGFHRISLTLTPGTQVAQAEREIAAGGQLAIYDWEANALVPGTGARVAQALRRSDETALTLSQGSESAAPGSSSAQAGGLSLYQAVQLAATQPYAPSRHNARYGNEYFLFGAPGSSACTAAAAAAGVRDAAGVHCLLDRDPVQVPPDAPASQVAAELAATLPAGVTLSQAQEFVVKQGTVVLQGFPQSFARWPDWGSADARYYILHDDVALLGSEITDPAQSTDPGGQPDVLFGFTGRGAAAFRELTAAVAERGSLDSTGPNASLDQHFAIAIDGQLMTVPYIDFKQYPDGISGSGGAEIVGGFTVHVARRLATELRLGALPVSLELVPAPGGRAADVGGMR